MNEKEFGQKLKTWLDGAAGRVGETQATRLEAARRRALDGYREPVRLFGWVPVAAGTAHWFRYSVLQPALLVVPVLALLAALAIQSPGDPDLGELGELEAQLLTQELPPDAFLDKEFREWLDNQG